MIDKLTQTCKIRGVLLQIGHKYEAEYQFSDLHTWNESVTQRWKCAVPRWLVLLDQCQIEMNCPAPWPCLWGISELWDMFAPASDPVMKYARAELCWQRWALLFPDERELLGWHGRNVRQHLSDGCHQHFGSTLSQILWWTWCHGLSFHHISFFFIWHFHCFWFGCFPQCSLFLVNAESIFLCLPVRQRFFQPSANAIFSQRKTERRSFNELVMTNCHWHR